MSFDVHLSVVFNCYENDSVAKLAKEYMEFLGIPEAPKDEWPAISEYDCEKEIGWFLTDLSRRSGKNWGPKGGVLTWGTVSNHLDAQGFVKDLDHFWFDLLTMKDERAMCSFEHIIVFYEREQSEQANCYEIYLNPNKRSNYTFEDLIFKHHKLPFCWNQY